ncbi:RidA family protein [Paracoccus mangrovi]|jgi:enamine deaminase RidA (YjgF/YER057c/UK114 family)|uniref:RidA family protein n=1 Tax=Paracoccus mangrovi TaxID=1715645 RepID=A0ABV7R025_9RHOB
MSIEKRLSELGIALPAAPAPAANYVPYVIVGNMLYISGQISTTKGRLGDDLSTQQGADAARSCGLALLAQASAALGTLDRVKQVVRLGGFVTSTPDFTEQPEVVNGCSDLMVEVFGPKGRHARAAVSVPALPRGVAVEVDAIFEIV